MPGKGRTDKWWRTYHALRKQGKTKEQAARIASKPPKKRKDR